MAPVMNNAVSTVLNLKILEPREEEGIGGHCLPKDTKMFLKSSKSIKSKILTAAMEVDQDYKTFRANSDRGIGSPLALKDNNKI